MGARRKLAWLGVWSIDTYSPNLVNFGPAIPCGDVHRSFTDALVSVSNFLRVTGAGMFSNFTSTFSRNRAFFLS